MRTVQEITAALPNLSTDELQHVEQVIRDLYRARHETIIYDDDYGIWTEPDQNSVAAEIFGLLDKAKKKQKTNRI